MADSKEIKEIRKNRDIRIKKRKDVDNLIADNGLDGYVIDVQDMLNRSSNPIIVKLRKLRNYGITDEMIVNIYSEITGKVESTESALDSLAAVFKKLALYINEQPNGIVLDLKTGEINRRESNIQAAQIGISDTIPPEKIKEITQSLAKDLMNNSKKNGTNDFFSILQSDIKYKNFYDNLSYISSPSMDIDEIVNHRNEIEKYNVSEKFKNALSNSIDSLAVISADERKLYDLEIKLKNAEGTADFPGLLKEKDKLLSRNDQLKQIQTRDKDGNLSDAILSYKENSEKAILGNMIGSYANRKIEELSPNERKTLRVIGLAAFQFEEYKADVWKIWGLHAKKKEEIYKTIGEELGISINNPKEFKEATKLCTIYVKQNLFKSNVVETIKNGEKISDGEMKEFIEAKSEDMQFDNLKKAVEENKKSNLMKYFDNSHITLTEQDEKKITERYKESTVNSWINKKEDVLKLEYAYLLLEKESLEDEKNKFAKDKEKTEDIKEKIRKNKERIKDFERKDKNIKKECTEKGELKEELREKSKNYNENKSVSTLLKFYSESARQGINREKYDNMFPAEQRKYLTKAIWGLAYAEKNNDESMLKLAYRSLEVLNTDENKFISFDKNGKAVINRELLVENYQDHEFKNKIHSSYDDLSEYIQKRCMELYVLNKLHEYGKLNEDQFKEVDKSDYAKALEVMENIKAMSNQIEQTSENKNIENEGEQKPDAKILSEEVDKASKVDTIPVVDSENIEEKPSKTAFDKIKDAFNRFKNAFNPQLTDGNQNSEENRLGLLGKITLGIKNVINPTYDKSSENDLNKKPEEIVDDGKKQESKMDQYVVPGISGKVSSGNPVASKDEEERNEIR